MSSTLFSSTLAQLVERSRRLGADRSVCNWGGGNTSAKADEIDFRGRPSRILWVKGSGSDLATCTEASFTGLSLDDLLPLLEREQMSDAEMVTYLGHCFFDPGRPRPSIETLLHAFLPFTHIDHTHADATNFFACAADGEALAHECFGDDLLWLPYRRPGFGLAREVALAVRANPQAKLVILAKHGLITWGESDEECFASTCSTIVRARTFVEKRIMEVDRPLFGGIRTMLSSPEERRAVAAHLAPTLRGLVSAERQQILHFVDDEDVLTFVSSHDAPRLTDIGAACPDHLVHTKPWPLLVDWTPEQGQDTLAEAVRNEEQLEELAHKVTPREYPYRPIFCYALADTLDQLPSLVSHLLDSNTPAFYGGATITSQGQIMATYEDMVPAVLTFYVPLQARSFSLHVDGAVYTQSFDVTWAEH